MADKTGDDEVYSKAGSGTAAFAMHRGLSVAAITV
jgi:hypothetical protein